MLSNEDKIQLSERGITEAQIESQLNDFKNGFP